MSTTFNPEDFLSTEAVGGFDTKLIPVPDGEYMGIIKDLRAQQFSSDEGPRHILNVIWSVDDATVKEIVGLKEPTVRQSVWLDMTPQGGLDRGRGKNVGLGKLLAALELNDPTRPFSFQMLKGRPAKIGVKATLNKKDGEMYAEVKTVTSLAAQAA